MGVQKIDPATYPLIRQLLDSRLVTLANLADLLGVSQSRLTQVRNNRHNIKTEDGWAVRKKES